MKTNQFNPSFMEKTEIVSFYKGKGPHDDLNSDRVRNVVRILESLDTTKTNQIRDGMNFRSESFMNVMGTSWGYHYKVLMWALVVSSRSLLLIGRV